MALPIDMESVFIRADRERASDIIFSAGMPPVLLIAGRLCHLGKKSLTAEEIREIAASLLEREQVARFERERELDFSVAYGNHLRFRGNAFWQRGAVGLALRLVPREIPKLSDLGLPPVIRELSEAPQGLVLVTGPTGHGKSTTQAAMIDHINRTRACHIVTVEDPIEFLHENQKSVIEQREVGSDTLSFDAALRHALRQAPHVILVGEIRDLETISIGMTAAETGHLVLATLHTNDAPQAVHRIIDVFPPHQQNQVRAQLSSVLLAVVAQRLLVGVDRSRRVMACEILRNTPAVANLIREDKVAQIPSIMETQSRMGMVSLDAAIKELYLAGKVDEEQARKYMKYPQHLFGH